MNQDLDVIDSTVQKTYGWLKDVQEAAGWPDRHRAYVALRAVLHALRDRLSVDENANLSAQLPMLIRGIYFEGWHPASTPSRERSREQFVAGVAQRLESQNVHDLSPELAVSAVFATLKRRITQGEMEDVLDMLPQNLRRSLAGV
jgi:uncharacterized protein (DUF2267 family)